MRLTESHLRKIVKEELKKVLINEEFTQKEQEVLTSASVKFGPNFAKMLEKLYNKERGATSKIHDFVHGLEIKFTDSQSTKKAQEIKDFIINSVPEYFKAGGGFAGDWAAQYTAAQDPESTYRIEEQERKPQGRAYGEPMNINPTRGLGGISAIGTAQLDAFQQIEKDYNLPTNSLVNLFAETGRDSAGRITFIKQLRSSQVGSEFEKALNDAATDENGRRNLNDEQVKQKVLAAIQKYKPNALKATLYGKLTRGVGQFGLGRTKE